MCAVFAADSLAVTARYSGCRYTALAVVSSGGGYCARNAGSGRRHADIAFALSFLDVLCAVVGLVNSHQTSGRSQRRRHDASQRAGKSRSAAPSTTATVTSTDASSTKDEGGKLVRGAECRVMARASGTKQRHNNHKQQRTGKTCDDVIQCGDVTPQRTNQVVAE